MENNAMLYTVRMKLEEHLNRQEIRKIQRASTESARARLAEYAEEMYNLGMQDSGVLVQVALHRLWKFGKDRLHKLNLEILKVDEEIKQGELIVIKHDGYTDVISKERWEAKCKERKARNNGNV